MTARQSVWLERKHQRVNELVRCGRKRFEKKRSKILYGDNNGVLFIINIKVLRI